MTEQRKKVTDDKPITWLTCYEYPTAYLPEQAGIERILVGDGLGMTMLGYNSTLPVTMDDMVCHTAPNAHGQLLIYHDMFGLYPKFKSKMAKVFGDARESSCRLAVLPRLGHRQNLPRSRELVRDEGRRV